MAGHFCCFLFFSVLILHLHRILLAGKMRATHVKGTFPRVQGYDISGGSVSYDSSKNASGLLL